MRSRPSLLLHPLFLISLCVLLLNDHYLKYQWHNWLTGKLSDFTGVFVLAVLLITVFGHRLYMCLLAGALFAYWKLPFSQPFIDWLNSLGFPAARAIDYTDLSSLIMLWPAYKLQPYNYLPKRLTHGLKIPVLLISLFAIVATAPPRGYYGHSYDLPKGFIWVYQDCKTKLSTDRILHKLDSMQIAWHQDSVIFFPANTRHLYFQYQQPGDNNTILKSFQSLKDTTIFYETVYNPFYIIPQVIVEQDTLKDIRFRITDEGKKRRIQVLTVTRDVNHEYTYKESLDLIKKYKKKMQAFLSE